MNKHPKISIVTPSYNQAQYLEETIKSVLDQGYPNLEYIIIDGGSTDGSVDIIKKYADKLAYWVSEPDNGQAHAIKKGFEKATGDILAWLNSDDVYEQGALKKIADVFEKTDADVVYGDEYLIDSEGIKIGERRQLPFPGKTLGSACLVYGGFNIYQPAAFWKKEIYEKVGGIDTDYKFTMDPDLFIRFTLHNASFKYVRKHVVSFRLHESSKTCTIQDIRASERKQLVEKYSSQIIPFIRNSLLTKILGWVYFSLHLFVGNGKYMGYEVFRRLGLIKTHRLLPY